MTFYGDGSDKSKFQKSIDGRIRRLHEFLAVTVCAGFLICSYLFI
jgi:hypothetical protein